MIIQKLKEYNHSVSPRKRYLMDFYGKIGGIYKNVYVHNSKNATFGIEIYKKLIWYISECHGNNQNLDYCAFHFLQEHKTIMLDRIKYYENLNLIKCSQEIHNAFEEIKCITDTIRNIVMKFNMKPTKSTYDSLINYMNYLNTEPKYITELINLLQ